MIFKAVSQVRVSCPENCSFFKGEHNYCFTPFLYEKFLDDETNELHHIAVSFNKNTCCTHCLQEPLLEYFETKDERDCFNKNVGIKYYFDFNNILFDYEYFLKIKGDKND